MREGGKGKDLVYRHRWPVRLWHWLNALAIFVMLMSGFMIFNAHPRLYWGKYGANFDQPWLRISAGHLNIGNTSLPTGGLLGVVNHGRLFAFPTAITIPSHYDLAAARQWHFTFAWLLVLSGIAFLAWALIGRHLWRDLWPRRDEVTPRHVWHDILDHLRLRFPKGEAALRYNILQKLAYLGVILLLIPGAILSGMAMSPGLDASWPWLLILFGGRQSARSVHFLCASGLSLFILVHLVMVVLAGPFNEIRSMITGWFRLPREREE